MIRRKLPHDMSMVLLLKIIDSYNPCYMKKQHQSSFFRSVLSPHSCAKHKELVVLAITIVYLTVDTAIFADKLR
jgi:hypothetical protein